MIKQLSISAMLAALAAAQTPQAQQPQSIAGVVKLNKAPVSNEAIKVKLPRAVEWHEAAGRGELSRTDH